MAHDSCLPACMSHCAAACGACYVGDAWGVQEPQERSVIMVAKSASVSDLEIEMSFSVFFCHPTVIHHPMFSSFR